MKALLYGCFGLILCLSCGRRQPYPPQKMFLQLEIDSAQMIYDRGNPEAAVDYLRNAFAHAERRTPRDMFYYYYFHFVLGSREEHAALENLRYADSMLTVIRQHHLEKELGTDYMQGLYAKGDILFRMGQYNAAFEHYFQARTIGQDRMTACDISDYNYRVGMVLYRQERYEEAAEYFKSCFRQNMDCEPSFGIFYRGQEVLSNTGLCYARVGQADSALKYYREGLAFIQTYQDSFPAKNGPFFDIARGVIYGNMGQVYLSVGKYDQALPLLQQSIEINRKPAHENRDAALAAIKLAQLYRETGDYEKILHALRTADSMLLIRPDASARLDWHRLMAWYYEQKGQMNPALNQLNRYLGVHDSLMREQAKLAKTDIIQRARILENQQQIASLQKKNEAKKFYLYLALVMMIMGLIIALLIYLNWRRSRRYIRSLTRLNRKVREHRNRLQQTLQQLEASNKEKDKILRVVAHDLRSPVAGIAALTDLLLQDQGLTPEQRDNLELIRLACEGSLTLSKEILEATGDFAPEKWELTPADICQLITQRVELLRFRAREKQQQINCTLPEGPVHITMNPEKIGRVIDNLIINAIKFSPPETHVDVSLEQEESGVLIRIRDQGIGIPRAIAGKIFDMFTEAKRYGTTGEKPYGLGLSISRQIIEAHGGSIWFESTPGEGSLFLIRLPYEAKLRLTPAEQDVSPGV
jgi:signal transduction histidine kinase